ncbi:MAG: PIN domain-containing protein [Gemmatimonadota bacterium]
MTIVADTSALLALVDADDAHHAEVLELWERTADAWVVPWAVLPEVDYVLRQHVGASAARLFLDDVCSGAWVVEHSDPSDLQRARALDTQYAGLGIGLVDGVVAAHAERLRARAIATLDVRHFGTLELEGAPLLFPRDHHA